MKFSKILYTQKFDLIAKCFCSETKILHCQLVLFKFFSIFVQQFYTKNISNLFQILGNTLASSVISYSKPFMLHMTTDSEEPHSGIAQNNRNFK